MRKLLALFFSLICTQLWAIDPAAKAEWLAGSTNFVLTQISSNTWLCLTADGRKFFVDESETPELMAWANQRDLRRRVEQFQNQREIYSALQILIKEIALVQEAILRLRKTTTVWGTGENINWTTNIVILTDPRFRQKIEELLRKGP